MTYPNGRKENSAKPTGTPRLAAPSWVIPGTVQENCRFLEGKVEEAALLFFDADASLAYTRRDLPLELAALALSYHVHLPLLLPWEAGGGAVAGICLSLMEKVDFLGAFRCVLHPPAEVAPSAGALLLEEFAAAWEKAGRSPADVCVENTRENSLAALLGTGLFGEGGLGVCLDLGHILAYGQDALAEAVMRRGCGPLSGGDVVRMLHYSAPGRAGAGGKGAHLPLTELDAAGSALGESMCAVLAPGGIVVAEFFSWGYVVRSLPVIRQWLAARAHGGAFGG